MEGKTKIVTPLFEGSPVGLVRTKNDITAGDGAKHDVMIGKAELATRTTCNVFEYLARKDIPTAYIGRDGPITFLSWLCLMIPVEVVVRGIATGSYLKRHPNVVQGLRLAKPVVEFFYKTTNRRIGERELPCDDPLMIFDNAQHVWRLYRPDLPMEDEKAYLGILDLTVADSDTLFDHLTECGKIATEVFTLLATAWERLGGTLYDFKLEFGTLSDGTIVVADVIDCDSWRVIWKGIQLSKQGYRDGDDLKRVLGVYRLAAALTDGL